MINIINFNLEIIDYAYYSISIFIHCILGLYLLFLSYNIYKRSKLANIAFTSRNRYFLLGLNLFFLSSLLIIISYFFENHVSMNLSKFYFILMFLSYGSLYWKINNDNNIIDTLNLITDLAFIMLLILYKANNLSNELDLLATTYFYAILAFYLIIHVTLNLIESVNLFLKNKLQKKFCYLSIVNSSLPLSYIVYLIGAVCNNLFLFTSGKLFMILSIFYVIKEVLIDFNSGMNKMVK